MYYGVEQVRGRTEQKSNEKGIETTGICHNWILQYFTPIVLI